MTPRFIRRPLHACGRYLRDLFRSPNGTRPVPIWVVVGSFAATASLVAAGVDAAANGSLQSNDLVTLQTDLGLVASDEFTGAAGTLPSARMWNIRTGDGGWGNDEKQTYTDSPQNVSLDGSGNLRIVARRDGDRVTSARIDTLGKFDTSTGLLAVRARLPEGQGIHPAIWMLGSGLEVVGYPESGEIDIYEHVNSVQDNSVGAIGPRTDLSIKTPWKVQRRLPAAEAATPGAYHVYWVYRQPGLVRIGLDGDTVITLTPDDIPAQSVWVMDDPFFLVLNVAAGGEWPGPVEADALPAEMSVDWVRMYG